HQDPPAARALLERRPEADLGEQREQPLDRVLLGERGVGRRALDQVVAPGLADLLELSARLRPEAGDERGQDLGEQPVAAAALLDRGRRGAVDDARAAAAPRRERLALDQTRFRERVQVHAHGVDVQADPPGELARVQRARVGELREDPRAARICERAVAAQRPLALGRRHSYIPSRNFASPLIRSGDQGGSKTSRTSTDSTPSTPASASTMPRSTTGPSGQPIDVSVWTTRTWPSSRSTA